jgi:hypothetical protein
MYDPSERKGADRLPIFYGIVPECSAAEDIHICLDNRLCRHDLWHRVDFGLSIDSNRLSILSVAFASERGGASPLMRPFNAKKSNCEQSDLNNGTAWRSCRAIQNQRR